MQTLIDSKQLAEQVGVPERTLAQWRYLGRGPSFVKVGSAVRYRETDVEAWLASRTVRAALDCGDAA